MTAYDRYMLQVGAGKHVKFRRLTVPERYAFFNGVLSLAARSPVRGCLMIGNLAAEPADVASECDVTEKVAGAAMDKLRSLGILERDGNGFEWVHDFEDYNPAPKQDRTAAQRQQRKRDRERASQRDVTPPSRRDVTVVTPPVTVRDAVTVTDRHADEVEVEVKTPTPFQLDFEEWVAHHEATTGHLQKRSTKAFRSIGDSYNARRAEGYTAEDLQLATLGAHGDAYRRENGYDTADSILRPTKVASLIAKGKLRSGGGQQAAKSSLQLAREMRGETA